MEDMRPYEILDEKTQLVCENEDCKVFKVDSDSGSGVMTMYTVFPGIFLLYSDFHTSKVDSGFIPNTEMLCIDHCREGRIEWKVSRNKYVYVETGDMQINSREDNICEFSFPLKHYHGLTIAFSLDEADQSLKHTLEGFSVDIKKIKDKFCHNGAPFIMRAGKRIEHIFMELYNVPNDIRITYFRIKVLELLLFLDTMEVTWDHCVPQYFYKTQVDKVKDIANFITQNLEKWYTLEELSKKFDISLTSMKRCFKGIYGVTINEYIREYRMNAASVMLKQSNESVIQIAGKVGYGNPSKFTSAFKHVIGMTPTEYRKSNE